MNKILIRNSFRTYLVKNCLWVFLVALLLLSVAYVLLAYSLTSETFKNRAAEEIDDLLTQIGIGGTPINIGKTSWGGLLHPLTVTLSDMSLTPSEDEEDELLPKFNYEMHHLKIGIGFIALLKGDLKINTLGVKNLQVYPFKLPASTPLGELSFHLDYGGPDFECTIEKCHINPKNLMGTHQVIPPVLQGIDLPLTLKGNLLYRDGRLEDGHLLVKTDRGLVKCPPYYPMEMMIQDMTSHVTVKDNLFIVEDLSFTHVNKPYQDVHVSFKGRMALEDDAHLLWTQGGGVHVSLEGEALNIPLDNLSTLWPMGLASNARDWVTKNITVGVASRATVNLAGRYVFGGAENESMDSSSPQNDSLSHRFNLTQLFGEIHAENVAVHYMEHLPFVTQTSGICRYTPDNFTIQAVGKVNGLTLESAHINISDFDKEDETIDIRLELLGPVENALEIIAKEPLALPQKLGFDPSIFQGASHTFVRLNFPLRKDVPLEKVKVHSHSKIFQGKILAKDDIGGASNPMVDGQFNLQVDNAHLELGGTATCFSMPTEVHWIERFNAGLEENQSEWHLKNTEDSLSVGTFDIDYLVKQNKSGSLSIMANLRDLVVQLPYFLVDKKKGDPLQLKIHSNFDSKNRHSIQLARLEGEGIHIESHGSLNLGDSKGNLVKTSDLSAIPLDGLELTLIQLGTLSGSLKVTGSYSKPQLKGKIKSLDISPLLQQDESSDFEMETDVQLDILVEKVKMSKNLSFENVSCHLDWQGNDLHSAHVKTQESGKMEFILTPTKVVSGKQGGKGQKFSLQSNDAGDLLDCFLPKNDLEGGVINVVGNRTRMGSEKIWDVEMDVRDVVVKKAPFLAQLLSATSFQGLLDTLSGSGIRFNRCTGRLTWADKEVLFQDFHLAGGSIGLDIEGTLSLASDEVDLIGEIYPLHGINHLMAQIPLVGDILSGGSNKGVFSTAFEAMGNKDNPRILVNPLTTIAPGAIRKVMKEVTQSLEALPESSLGQASPNESTSKHDGK